MPSVPGAAESAEAGSGNTRGVNGTGLSIGRSSAALYTPAFETSYSQKLVSTVSFDVQDSMRSVSKASDQAEPADRKVIFDRLKSALPAVIGLVLFVVALGVLRRELHAVTWHELVHDVV